MNKEGSHGVTEWTYVWFFYKTNMTYLPVGIYYIIYIMKNLEFLT